MKYSKYNTYIDISPQIGCIYNAMSDKTIVLHGNYIGIADEKELPDKLKKQFVDNGILVEDDTDEYTEYLKWAREIENDKSYFHLLLNPTLNCNFHCHYCYESHFNSKMDSDTIEKIKRLIVRQLEDGQDFVMSFFGGEPMLYFEDIMKPLIEFAEDKATEFGRSFSCNMTSNGYLLDEEKVKWLASHSFTSAQITLDGSRDVHNKVRYRHHGDNTYDRIVENIRVLAENGISVTLRLNCTESNIDSLSDIPGSFEDLSDDDKKRITVDMHIVWQENNKNRLFTRMDETVNSFLDKGIYASRNDFRGFCYADRRNGCLVNYNGDVYKCTARDFVKNPRDGYIDHDGTIVWENDSLNRRMESKFRNPHCRDCRIFPLCHGGCSTNSLESKDYCLYNFSENEIDDVVKGRIVHNSIINRHA